MKIFSFILIQLIKIYKMVFSPLLGNNCRYLPTCSDYFIDCLKTYGLVKGILKGTKRILSCHPLGGEGFDPVKKIKLKK
tara:strand:- start:1037 stop:1273 length:237 start_codon:yes stop_codon:yes gene_type:complete